MRLLLYDAAPPGDWRPFDLTRPLSELRFGVLLQRERLERFAGTGATGLLSHPWLASYAEAGAPPILERIPEPDGEDLLLLDSRLVPEPGDRFEPPGDGRPARLTAEGRTVGLHLPAGSAGPDRGGSSGPVAPDRGDGDRGEGAHGEGGRRKSVRAAPEGGAGEALAALPRLPADAPALPLAAGLLEAPWELVGRGAERLGRDLRALAPRERRAAGPPDGCHLLGEEGLFLGPGVRVEPGVLFDTRRGPVWLDREVEVRAGCRLAGPLYAGPGSRLLGGPFETLAAGPVSYLRGELSAVTTLGWVNKAHEGHLGHAVLGRWVNLGASTVNSDLKNNYRPVRLGGPEGPRETGLLKMGALLGDHVRTAIGTLLPTGCVVGAGANLFGPPRAPSWVPPFAWGHGPGAGVYRREAFLATARTVLERRSVPWGPETEAWLAAVWEEARRRREFDPEGSTGSRSDGGTGDRSREATGGPDAG